MLETLTKPINLLVVDDHPIVRNSITRITANLEKIDRCEQAENGEIALEKLREKHYDILFLDIHMPVMDGITTMRHIHESFPKQDVIVFTMFLNRLQCIEMLELGVKSYLLKDTDETEIIKAVSTVLEGGKYLTPAIGQLWTDYLKLKQENLPKSTSINLTGRELEVLNLICQQFSVKEIANKLFLSEATVNNHRSHIMKKTGIYTSVGLAIFAVQYGYFTPYK